MRRVAIAIATLVMFFAGVHHVRAQHPAADRLRHLTNFALDGAYEGFEHAERPLDSVLDALLKSEMAQQAGDDFDALDREGKRKCFSVVRVDLASLSDEDYIAKGECAGLMPVDTGCFWIVRVNQGQARVILFDGGLGVTILRHRTNGFHDIETGYGGNSGWGMNIYRYNGSEYKLAKKNWHEVK